MAGAWGNELWSGANSWKAGVYADVVGDSDTTARIRVRCVWWGRYGFQVPNGNTQYIECDGQTGGWGAARGISGSGEQQISEWTYTVNKTENARNIRCVAGVHMGGYIVGTSTATCYVTIGGIKYKEPNPPKNVTVSRVNDTTLDVKWQSNYDNAALKIWRQIIVDIRDDTPSQAGAWHNVKTLNWDATSYRITGLSANHRYFVAVYARSPAGDSDHVNLGWYYMTPDKPRAVTVTKTSNSSARVDVDLSNTFANTVTIHRKVGSAGDAWIQNVTVSPDAKGASWDDTDVPGGTIQYMAYVTTYVNGSSGATVRSGETWGNTITTVQVPNAPTITSPADTITREVNSSVTVEWSINHPDGTAQRDAQVEITYPNSTTSVKYVGGNTRSYTISGLVAGTYKVRVQTRGLHNSYGAWSAYKTIRVAQRPVVQISSPTSDWVLRNLPLTVAWSVADPTGVSQQRVTFSCDGRELVRRDVAAGVRQLVVNSDSFVPANNSVLLVTVWVRGGSGLESQTSVSVPVEYESPAAPAVSVSYDGARLTPMVSVRFNRVEPDASFPEYFTFRDSDGSSVLANYYTVSDDDGSTVAVPLSAGAWKPKTVYATVHRVNPDGTLTLIAGKLLDGDVIEDTLAPLNTVFSYRVTAYSAAGAARSVDVESNVSSQFATLVFGAGASESLLLGYNMRVSFKPVVQTVEYHFVGTRYPRSYSLDMADETLMVDCVYPWDAALYGRLQELFQKYTYGWLRLPDGSCRRVRVVPNMSVDTAQGKMIECSFELTTLEWEEPQW